ncbi:hypothetical protein SAMN04515671_1356 [Nakamurella panacisegetis]|uniref:HNH endonuclease n=2 Tax=Nakamurella panacisegetis TaxID=1090615 RepID=A0A1H0KLJ4_9ACTN|nr:hypothetical protein SAMN04515671_1356 [Nakamurella panacisegetis]
MANRNYTLPTIKTLFGQASKCAWPGCGESLILTDRGAETVIAEIAHIRSEKPGGPRYDPTFKDAIDGAANLMLLCGRHHKPIDRHDNLYSIAELLQWKADQVAGAGSGTHISDAEARLFGGLTPEERAAITEIAKLTSRVESACSRVRDDLNRLESEHAEAVREMQRTVGPSYEIHDDGTEKVIYPTDLPRVEDYRWMEARSDILRAAAPLINQALDALAEQVAVLRMMNPFLGGPANTVLLTAQGAGQHVVGEDALNVSLAAMHGALEELWETTQP